jgi:hypothetical protein
MSKPHPTPVPTISGSALRGVVEFWLHAGVLNALSQLPIAKVDVQVVNVGSNVQSRHEKKTKNYRHEASMNYEALALQRRTKTEEMKILKGVLKLIKFWPRK